MPQEFRRRIFESGALSTLKRQFRVRMGAYISSAYRCPLGELQGDVTAPIKWSFVIDPLLRELAALRFQGQRRLDSPGMETRPTVVGVADDVVVVVSVAANKAVDAYSSITDRLQQVATVIDRWCLSAGMTLSRKTKVDLFARHNWTTCGRVRLPLPTVSVGGSTCTANNDESVPPKFFGVPLWPRWWLRSAVALRGGSAQLGRR